MADELASLSARAGGQYVSAAARPLSPERLQALPEPEPEPEPQPRSGSGGASRGVAGFGQKQLAEVEVDEAQMPAGLSMVKRMAWRKSQAAAARAVSPPALPSREEAAAARQRARARSPAKRGKARRTLSYSAAGQGGGGGGGGGGISRSRSSPGLVRTV